MTREEYERRREEIIKSHEKQIAELRRDYSASVNPYKVGDIIEDHIGKGMIISIYHSWDTLNDKPMSRYFCQNLTKKGEVNKKEPERYIFSTNIKK